MGPGLWVVPIWPRAWSFQSFLKYTHMGHWYHCPSGLWTPPLGPHQLCQEVRVGWETPKALSSPEAL